MYNKPTKLMLFHKNTILNYIPEANTVYFLRGIADENSLYPIYYIGRAKRGEFREKLLNMYFNNEWNDVVYINFVECDDHHEAAKLEKDELKRHSPKYNKKFVTSKFFQQNHNNFQFNY